LLLLPRITPTTRLFAIGLAAIAALATVARRVETAQGGSSYTLINADGRRTLTFRTAGNVDLLPLGDLAPVFGLTVSEDAAAGGVLVSGRGPLIVLTPGQSLVSVGGRIVALSGAVTRDGRNYFVPIDFLSRVLGPSLNLKIDVRRATRVIIVGDVRVPQVQVKMERQQANASISVDVQPPTPHRITRDNARITIRFEADSLDLAPVTGALPDFVTGIHVEGPALLIDLGPSAANARTNDDAARFSIDLFAPGAAVTPPPAPPQAAPPPEPPVIDRAPAGTIRTVVIDPGHGGTDEGAHGAGGTKEKDLALAFSRRLKAAIEGRIGLHVVLTREGDEDLTLDRRTAIANNNKADLFLSIHANASVRPVAHGTQVLSLNLDDYKNVTLGRLGKSEPVPVIGGGTRLIEAVPWDFAQISHARASAALGAVLVRHFTSENVPVFSRPLDNAPLRVLASSYTPAVVIELGFLTNAGDEKALNGDALPNSIVSAIVAAISEVRGGIPAPGRGAGGQ
jgi:N-acetylmuramoyl-L-alanine amidase